MKCGNSTLPIESGILLEAQESSQIMERRYFTFKLYFVLFKYKGVSSTFNTPGGRVSGGHVYDGELFWVFGGIGRDATGKY
jgi:hypothetical protein